MKPARFIRLRTALDGKRPAGERFFAAAELICLPLSFATFGYVVAEAACRRVFGCGALTPEADSALERWTIPVLAAAAIGYVTNWLAIKMLFEPRERTWRHWISWLTLGFWRQGLLPKNKAKMARELGQTFGRRLLDPEKLVAELSAKAESFLSDPEVARKIKDEAQALLRENADAVAAFVVPEIEQAAGGLLDRLLTPEKIREFWDETLAPRLSDEGTRATIAEKIISVARRSAPDLSRTIQRELRMHLRVELGRSLVGQLVPDEALDFVIDSMLSYFADNETIRCKVTEWLRKPETAALLKEKLVLLGEQATFWMHGEEGRAAMGCFAAEIKGKASGALSDYAKTAIPEFVGAALDSPKLWNWAEKSALPALRRRLIAYLGENGDHLIASFDLPGRIETAVNALDTAGFQTMLDRLMARHLSAIQVLGYILGAIVGALQCL